MRAAIGATAGRLLRQLLVESAVVALIGGVAGVLLASWCISAIRSGALGIDLPRLHELRFDAVIVVFALALTLGTLRFAGAGTSTSGCVDTCAPAVVGESE